MVKDSQRRRCLIVVGDSIGDLNMSQGIEYDDIVTIGFLNDKGSDRLPGYLAAWDVVLTAPESFDFVLEILRKL